MWTKFFLFEPSAKKHLPFFSYAAKHREQHFPLFSEALFFVHEALFPFLFSLLAEAIILCYEDDYPTYA